ncbi:hypothetical protein KC19_VG196800 [Ceratodon purpureus]|uniref:Uncharacterized protein n=1 Tax=Ceratodon purpureus TaxID=3225 RepID=A0A8T0HT05_CERPU|nr:hypothetical protein KC19_VG196800 [Ceratodon purpureus]
MKTNKHIVRMNSYARCLQLPPVVIPITKENQEQEFAQNEIYPSNLIQTKQISVTDQQRSVTTSRYHTAEVTEPSITLVTLENNQLNVVFHSALKIKKQVDRQLHRCVTHSNTVNTPEEETKQPR